MSALTKNEARAILSKQRFCSPRMIISDNGYFGAIYADTIKAHIIAGTASNNCMEYFARKESGYNLRKDLLTERCVCIVYKPLSADEVDALAEKHNLKFKGE